MWDARAESRLTASAVKHAVQCGSRERVSSPSIGRPQEVGVVTRARICYQRRLGRYPTYSEAAAVRVLPVNDVESACSFPPCGVYVQADEPVAVEKCSGNPYLSAHISYAVV